MLGQREGIGNDRHMYIRICTCMHLGTFDKSVLAFMLLDCGRG